jgi:hypothetical protein
MDLADQQSHTVRGLWIPASGIDPVEAIDFVRDERGHLPALRALLGEQITSVTVLTTVDVVGGRRHAKDRINTRARGACALLQADIACGHLPASALDRARARRVLAGELSMPDPRGPVVLLGTDLDSGNYASLTEEMISALAADTLQLLLLGTEPGTELARVS